MSASAYEVLLLGEPHVRQIGGETLQIGTKPMGLIARIFASRNGQLGRRELSGLLWPQASEARARHSLSQALYVINRTLPNLLVCEPELIRVGDGWCDLDEFRRSVKESNWIRASALYRGGFLRDLGIEDCTAFSHWRDGVREDLSALAESVVHGLYHNLLWTALGELTAVLVEQGRISHTVVSARVAAIAQTEGRPVAAAFVDTLPEELLPVGNAALEAYGQSFFPSGRSAQLFVGRAEQMRRLTDVFESAVNSRPSIALITGEPGIGKTALANRLYRLLAIRGAQVLMATAHAAEHNVPLGIVEQWLRDVSRADLDRVAAQPWMAVIGHVFPGIERNEQPRSRVNVGSIGYHRLLESIRRLLVELADRKPLVLGVDDLHHADPASISLVHYLFRRDPVGPTMVVATTRTEGSADVSWLDEWEDVSRINVEGLKLKEIETWLNGIDGSWTNSRQAATALLNRTGGNPLLISALLEEGATQDVSDAAPQSVIDFYSPRITARSGEARRLLAAISIVGEASSWNELAEIVDLDPNQCLDAVRELEGLNWVEVDGETLAIRHGLLGQAAVSLLSAVERKTLHGRAARVLSTTGVSPHAMVAVSHDLAGNQADAFDAALRAVKACDTLHARSEKEFFLKLGLSNAPSPSAAAEVRIQLAEHLLDERRSPEALDTVDPAFFSGLSVEHRMRAELVRVKIDAEMATKVEDLSVLWDRAEALRKEMGSLALADTYALLAGISHDLGFDRRSLEIAEQIALHLSELPLTLESARKLLRPIVIIGMSRGFQGALKKFEDLPRPTEGDPHYACAYHARRASLLVAAGRLLEAEADFAQAFGFAERYALFDRLFFIHNNLGVCLLEQGRFDEAEAHFLAAGNYVDPQITPGHHWIVEDNLMILEYERRDYAKALEMAEASKGDRIGSSVRAGMSLHCMIGLCSLEHGALARSKEAEREIRFMAERHDPTGNDMSYINVFLARMLHLRDETGPALKLLSEAADWYEPRNVLAYARIKLEQCRLASRTGVAFQADLNYLRLILKGSGAVPLLDATESLMARA